MAGAADSALEQRRAMLGVVSGAFDVIGKGNYFDLKGLYQEATGNVPGRIHAGIDKGQAGRLVRDCISDFVQ